LLPRLTALRTLRFRGSWDMLIHALIFKGSPCLLASPCLRLVDFDEPSDKIAEIIEWLRTQKDQGFGVEEVLIRMTPNVSVQDIDRINEVVGNITFL
jgi:hypothetical protein